MITIPPKRTARMAVKMRELRIGESMSLCRMPPELIASAETAFLRFVCEFSAPTPFHVTDPLLLSVEERALLVSSYLSAVFDEPDFEVGGQRYSDYLRLDSDLRSMPLQMGEIGGSQRYLWPLLGIHAELLEKVCRTPGEWERGAIAVRVTDTDQPVDLLSLTDVERIEWRDARIGEFDALPESTAIEIMHAYAAQSAAMAHFFNLAFDSQGPCYLPTGGAGDAGRFPAASVVSEAARRLAGTMDRSVR